MKIDIFNTNKKYNIIYADPPWQYGGTGGSKWAPASNYYSVMSDKELIEFGKIVKNISEENCILFLWAVSPHLKECINVGESWGFKYITVGFVWYKQRANCGNYTMSSCEPCLIFKKGKIPSDRVRNPGTKQFVSEPISKHSKKPDEVRKRIEQLFPKSSRIELFAREEYLNWDSWGDEL